MWPFPGTFDGEDQIQEEAPNGDTHAPAAQHASELQAVRLQLQDKDEQIRQQEEELRGLRER